jgi:hypothetical protein
MTASNEHGCIISHKDQGIEPTRSDERQRRNGWWDSSANGSAIAMDNGSSHAQEQPLSSSSIFGI